ncbi:hypothetical protein SAMN04489735_104521 [Aneurinibacillus thermoaerophilus]|uniref:Uncharacterized protein n=1 Tax=Aneurinibacillus thermoaerophilus TaxID=143495 RepID=A0A1G8ELA5_ANETH|nr:hypothetical protein [Aneurinibacillus thermoaerophilus]SDH70499.1 hypothetical protein SAMN04489735_104521 [Aneurinibacillus thermoaerophilus]
MGRSKKKSDGKLKRIGDAQRETYKKIYGVKPSDSKRKRCGNCLKHVNLKICSKYHILTSPYEVCGAFTPDSRIRFFRGGSTSPK